MYVVLYVDNVCFIINIFACLKIFVKSLILNREEKSNFYLYEPAKTSHAKKL